jgi:hypothetical protein
MIKDCNPKEPIDVIGHLHMCGPVSKISCKNSDKTKSKLRRSVVICDESENAILVSFWG